MTRSSSYGAMPGSFVQNDPPAGPKSHFFQPPQTPSASSSLYLTRSMTSNFSATSDRPTMTGRKRSRQDYTTESNVTPQSMTGDWSTGIETIDSMARSELMDPGSPLPFVNTRYQIKGGLDTPSAVQAAEGEESEYSDIGYRKSLTGTTQNHRPSYFPQTSGVQITEGNERPRVSDIPLQRDTLGKALGVVGGVVSKVWDFCTAGAFRGFYAGGGNSYTISPDLNVNSSCPLPSTEESFWLGDNIGRQAPSSREDKASTPVPGTFPEDELTSQDQYPSFSTRDTTPPRAAKRRLTGMDPHNDDLARNWVMVPGSQGSKPSNSAKAKTPMSAARPIARYSMPTASSANKRPISKAAARPASRASAGAALRRPALAGSRQSNVSHAGSPGLNPGRPASFASPRSPGSSKFPKAAQVYTPVKNTNAGVMGSEAVPSPLSIEAQQWAEQRRIEDAEADESMRRFNARLKAMIREGKEALGTTVDVEMGDLDSDMGTVEGFEAVGKWGD